MDKAEYVELETGRRRRPWLKILIFVILGIILLAVLVTIIALVAKKKDGGGDEPEGDLDLSKKIDVNNVYNHLENLYSIAGQYSNSRAIMKGYNASVAYVVQRLQEAGYEPKIQYFSVPVSERRASPLFSQVSPKQVNYVENTDFLNMGPYNGQIRLNGVLTAVGDLGCNSTDYVNVTGTIAVVLRGVCTFDQKIANAVAAGATGLLIYNDGQPGRTGPFTGSVSPAPIPVFSLSYNLGMDLAEMAGLAPITVQMYSYDVAYNATTMNVIAETDEGRSDRVVVLGSHLDSVPAGPGINDNGSGTSANLEIAIQMAENDEMLSIVNKVRFCWWGAEEIGLVGSTYYVNELKRRNQLTNVVLNINIDMIASPNYIYGVYDGSGAAPNIRNASISIQKSFQQYFASIKKNSITTPFTGRSDYGPFIENGIPAGGLFTGAEGIKQVNERALFGGMARAAYDSCYHLNCDDLLNINKDALKDMSQATAFVLQKYFSAEDIYSLLQGN